MASTALSLESELDAVNLLLAAIQESPVNSLTGSEGGDVPDARRALKIASDEVQLGSFQFNLDKSYVLTRESGTLEFPLPTNVLTCDTVGNDRNVDVVIRGSRLYDRLENRFTFPDNPTLCVDIKWALPFTDLPYAARHYIAIKAARRFIEDKIGAQNLSGFKEMDEEQARRTLRKTDKASSDLNILTGNAHSLTITAGRWRRPKLRGY